MVDFGNKGLKNLERNKVCFMFGSNFFYVFFFCFNGNVMNRMPNACVVAPVVLF